MMRFLCLFTLFVSAFAFSQVEEITRNLDVDYTQSTIRSRFQPPRGYVWIKEQPGSFGDFLVNFPLYPENFPIRDYQQIPISKQNNHAAILKIDVGEKDLQQCADAWIRLYAEHLWSKKEYDKIVFEFTSGQKLSWNDFKKGMRSTELKDRVKFHQSAKFDDSYSNFRNYLNLVFNYAGTISLDRESIPILKNSDIQTGDFLIKPGSPGHSVFIVGRAQNAKGRTVYLLAESFMPAQDVHIIKNHSNQLISPWYVLDVNAPATKTSRYLFRPTSIKRFHQLYKKE